MKDQKKTTSWIEGLIVGEIRIRDKHDQLWSTITKYDKYNRPYYEKKQKIKG